MNRARKLLGLVGLLPLAFSACGGETEPAAGAKGSGSSTTSASSGAGGGGAAAPGERTLVSIGGGTHVCTSASTADCAGAPTFPQKTDLPRKTDAGDLYEVTEEAVARLEQRPDLPDAVKAGLASLPMNEPRTYDEMLDDLDLVIGLDLLPNGSRERAIVLGYTILRQEEVVDLAASASAATRAIFQEVVEAAGGAGEAVIGVVSASSGDGFDSYLFHEQVFLQAGAKEVRWVPVNLAYRFAVDAGDCGAVGAHLESEYALYDAERRYPELYARLEEACAAPEGVSALVAGLTGIFFTGGDQAKHKAALIEAGVDTAEMAALRARFEAGRLVVAGSSAGTAVQAARPEAPMVTGGESYNALVWGAHEAPCDAPAGDVCHDDLTFDGDGGLGFFAHGLIDTHFSERGRQARLVRLAADTGQKLAFGVDENTALITRNVGTPEASMTVLGEGGVFVFDLRGATGGAPGDFAIEGVRASYLKSGDGFDPAAMAVTFAPDKADMAGTETYPEPMSPSEDLLSSANDVDPVNGGRKHPREWALVSEDLCDAEAPSTYGTSYEGPGLSADYPLTYEVVLSKDAQTRCFDGPGQGDVAFADMVVDIHPQ